MIGGLARLIVFNNGRRLFEHFLQQFNELGFAHLFHSKPQILVYGRLRSVVHKVMPCAFLPSVEYRLMYPLIVLPSERKVVFVPHERLRILKSCVYHRFSKVDRFLCAVEHINGRTLFQSAFRRLVKRQQELIELVIGEVIVCYVAVIACFGLILSNNRRAVINIIRRIGNHHVRRLAVQNAPHVLDLRTIAAQ